MARKIDDNLNNMTLRQLKAYSNTNPLEGKRIANQCKETAKHASKNYTMAKKAKLFDDITSI